MPTKVKHTVFDVLSARKNSRTEEIKKEDIDSGRKICLKRTLEKMCKIGGHDSKKVINRNFFKKSDKHGFYILDSVRTKLTWTKKQEKEFRDWFIYFIEKNKIVQKEFNIDIEKEDVKDFVDVFIWSYGFKVVD